nr:uncharacterized protein LOC107456429 [Parasteatoda tepidariorum]
MSEISYLKSSRGGYLILYKNYLFTLHSKYKNETSYWKCEQKNCSAKLTTINGFLKNAIETHNHAPDFHKIRRKTFYNKLKSRCETEFSEAIPRLYRQEIGEVAQTVETAVRLPDLKTACRTMYRARTKALPPLPSTLKDITVNGQWAKTIDGRDFLLVDDQITGERILVSIPFFPLFIYTLHTSSHFSEE